MKMSRFILSLITLLLVAFIVGQGAAAKITKAVKCTGKPVIGYECKRVKGKCDCSVWKGCPDGYEEVKPKKAGEKNACIIIKKKTNTSNTSTVSKKSSNKKVTNVKSKKPSNKKVTIVKNKKSSKKKVTNVRKKLTSNKKKTKKKNGKNKKVHKCPRGSAKKRIGSKFICTRFRRRCRRGYKLRGSRCRWVGCARGFVRRKLGGIKFCARRRRKGCPRGFRKIRGTCRFFGCPRGYIKRNITGRGYCCIRIRKRFNMYAVLYHIRLRLRPYPVISWVKGRMMRTLRRLTSDQIYLLSIFKKLKQAKKGNCRHMLLALIKRLRFVIRNRKAAYSKLRRHVNALRRRRIRQLWSTARHLRQLLRLSRRNRNIRRWRRVLQNLYKQAKRGMTFRRLGRQYLLTRKQTKWYRNRRKRTKKSKQKIQKKLRKLAKKVKKYKNKLAKSKRQRKKLQKSVVQKRIAYYKLMLKRTRRNNRSALKKIKVLSKALKKKKGSSYYHTRFKIRQLLYRQLSFMLQIFRYLKSLRKEQVRREYRKISYLRRRYSRRLVSIVRRIYLQVRKTKKKAERQQLLKKLTSERQKFKKVLAKLNKRLTALRKKDRKAKLKALKYRLKWLKKCLRIARIHVMYDKRVLKKAKRTIYKKWAKKALLYATYVFRRFRRNYFNGLRSIHAIVMRARNSKLYKFRRQVRGVRRQIRKLRNRKTYLLIYSMTKGQAEHKLKLYMNRIRMFKNRIRVYRKNVKKFRTNAKKVRRLERRLRKQKSNSKKRKKIQKIIQKYKKTRDAFKKKARKYFKSKREQRRARVMVWKLTRYIKHGFRSRRISIKAAKKQRGPIAAKVKKLKKRLRALQAKYRQARLRARKSTKRSGKGKVA